MSYTPPIAEQRFVLDTVTGIGELSEHAAFAEATPDMVDAILEGHKACDDFSHGGPMTEAVLVGAMADRVAGQWLEWDAAKLEFKGNAAANKLVRRTYRDGWKVPGLG